MSAPRTELAWDTLLDLDGADAGPGPLHHRLTGALRTAIRDGRLSPGSALPPSRALAADLGCSRWVVTQAYEQLLAEGYLTARTGSATRVREVGSTPAPPRRGPESAAAAPRFDLAPGLPDLRAFPRRRWADAVRSQLSTIPYPELGYQSRRGSERLRAVMTEYLRRVRGGAGTPHDVTICAGVTDGVARLCRVLRDAGIRRIAVEDPGWTRLRETIAGLGFEIVGIPVDAKGLRVDDLLEQSNVRVVLLSPAHQFPTGVVLAPERRAALLSWARDVDGLILEDDYDAEFRYDRRPVGTMQGTDPNRVVLFGSLSKTLSPALGIGWMLTPGRWTEDLRTAEGGVAAWPPPLLDQLAFASFVESGGYDRHLRAARQRYRHRRDLLVHELGGRLPDCPMSSVKAGLHLVLHLDRDRSAADVVARADRSGVKVADLDSYRLRPNPGEPGLVLGYGNLPDGSVVPAAERLAAAVRSSPGRS